MTDTITPEQATRQAFERHWLSIRGLKKAKRELNRHPLQSQCYVEDSANRHWVTWQAALKQQEQQGWVRVPVEPTPEMINAGRTTPMPSDSEFDEDDDYRAVFIAMVASAPRGGL